MVKLDWAKLAPARQRALRSLTAQPAGHSGPCTPRAIGRCLTSPEIRTVAHLALARGVDLPLAGEKAPRSWPRRTHGTYPPGVAEVASVHSPPGRGVAGRKNEEE